MRTGLATPASSLSLGESTPDAVIYRRVHRVTETLLLDRASPADPLRRLVLDCPDGEEKIGIRIGAEAVSAPILIDHNEFQSPLLWTPGPALVL